ncbi:MAG: GMC family oxidoreductase N-terminal domain-containing protein [Candidatus Tyrphobacter sp.]
MIADPYERAAELGWRITDSSQLTDDLSLDTDVAIVGTGAGGGTAAEILARSGLRVVMIEEGALRTSRDFRMLERQAYPQLYADSAGRKTRDKGITILQGRTVGGSTTVNWTASFRTPPATLSFWQSNYGLSDFTTEALAPWFERMERRLSIAPWSEPPNENNAALLRGTAALGVSAGVVPRNVRACHNLGYCGMGCPTNAKQSMLVTTIPGALDRGATLLARAFAARLRTDGNRASSLECDALDADGLRKTGRRITVRAHAFVCAAGGIGTPGLLLRSGVPDRSGLLGKRTFLHPTVVSAAQMPHAVDAFSGAPQSIYSDAFLETPFDGPVGFKLEVPPVHPVLVATALPGLGTQHSDLAGQMAHTHVVIALLRDGFHRESQGGNVAVARDGTPVLDYPMTPYLWEGARRAFASMAEIQFAAGATAVFPLHESATPYATLEQAKAGIAALAMKSLAARVMSAHVMGGCAMSADPACGVVDPSGRHHHLRNVYIFDGSMFPTSLGTNPQLSIYAIVARDASRLAERMTQGPSA